jgi:hypothetical protein
MRIIRRAELSDFLQNQAVTNRLLTIGWAGESEQITAASAGSEGHFVAAARARRCSVLYILR